ncbi:MAG: caspase family protein [Lentisphaeraceae bacterium]|nr:caspase family protein [Lentisphaeraceae bacterium]
MRLLIFLLILTSQSMMARVLNVGQSKEFTDLNKAISESKEGDTIFIYPGVYELESKDGINFLQIKSGVNIKGIDRHKVIIKPKGESPAFEALLKIIDKENISIEEVTLDSPHGNVFIKDSDKIIIKNCIFKGFRWNAQRKMALVVNPASTFGSSSDLKFEHILFYSCNPVHLGRGNSGEFTDICIYKVENSNYWHLSNSSSWVYKDVTVHNTILKKSHQNVDQIHNLASPLPWIIKRDGLSWGAVKALWVPLKPRTEEKVASSNSFFDSLENSSDKDDAIDINIEIREEAVIDKEGPEIYIEERQRFRDLKVGVPNNILKGKAIDTSGVASLVISEKSPEVSKGITPTLHTHEVKLIDGNFEQELELDKEENLITILATDSKGNRSFSSLIIKRTLPSSKHDDSPNIHLFKKKTSSKIVNIERPKTEKESFMIVRGYVDYPESITQITVGHVPAAIDKLGNFSAVTPLNKGENEIKITVFNKAGKQDSETFEVKADFSNSIKDMEKPEIRLTQTRSLEQKILGRIIDKSSIPLFIINGEEVELDKEGSFEYQLDLNPNDNIVKMVAYDTSGNYTVEQKNISGVEVYQSITKNVEFHALVIGINNYKHLSNLKTPISDATAVKDVLEKNYGFNVTMLKNANRKHIINQIEKMRESLKPEHKLLIYYAGHGYYDEKTDRSFWLPADAEKEDSAFWISSLEIKTNLRYSNPKNILLISDSCFSGTLSGKRYRSAINGSHDETPSIKTKLSRPCRLLLSSGGNEPVVDGNKNHSIFAEALLWALREPPADIFSVSDIYPDIYEIVTNGETKQKPDLEFIQGTGHIPGGGFVFRRVKK